MKIADFKNFHARTHKIARTVHSDFKASITVTGDKTLQNEMCKKLIKISQAKYCLKIEASVAFLKKILPKLLKERAKRKSAADPTNDLLRDAFSTPGLPEKTEK